MKMTRIAAITTALAAAALRWSGTGCYWGP